MVQIIAREVEAAKVGLKIQVFPSSSLYKATEQWGAITRGQLDMSAFPLDYASGRVPQFSATLMPGLVRNYDHAQRLNQSDFMKYIKALVEDKGDRKRVVKGQSVYVREELGGRRLIKQKTRQTMSYTAEQRNTNT